MAVVRVLRIPLSCITKSVGIAGAVGIVGREDNRECMKEDIQRHFFGPEQR